MPVDSQIRHVPTASEFISGVKLRLIELEGSPSLPRWQQAHRISNWSVTNGGKRVQFNRVMGDVMIANFKRGVVKKGIHFDFEHGRGPLGKQAGGDIVDIRWGSEFQGLPGHPEPDGVGPVLYVAVEYNNLGNEVLLDRRYTSLSPTYSLDYQDTETGQHFGPTLVALTATNDPFARFRSIQGESLHLVLLEDQNTEGDRTMPTMEELEARIQELETSNTDLRIANHTVATTAILDKAKAAGVPPALVDRLGLIMLSADPDYEQTFELESAKGDKPAVTANLYGVVESVLEMLPTMKLERQQTHGSGGRPPQGGADIESQLRQGGRDLRNRLSGKKAETQSNNGTGA